MTDNVQGDLAAERYFLLNEITVFYFLFLAFSGKRPVFIDVIPLTLLGRPLRRLADYLMNRGRAVHVRHAVPSTERFWERMDPTETGAYFDWVASLHPHLSEVFALAGLDRDHGDYARPARSCLGQYLHERIYLIFLARDLRSRERTAVLVGFPDDLAELYRRYWHEPFPVRRTWRWQGRAIWNTLLLVGAFAITLVRLCRLLRWSAPPPEDVFFAVDQLDDTTDRNIRLAREIIGDDARPLFVLRYDAMAGRPECMAPLAGESWCLRTSGAIDRAMLPGTLAILFSDLPRLWKSTLGLPPQVVRAVLGLAYWRLVYRAFFRVRRVRYFWCRDDYTAEHHMRSQELRKLGGATMGVRHGVCWTGQLLQYGYMDFDYFYYFGDERAHEFYRTVWPAHMKVTAIGTWGMTNAQRRALPEKAPPNIVMAVSNAPGALAITDGVRRCAERFPDRTIYFCPKATTYPRYPALSQAIREIFADLPANVVVPAGGTYDGMRNSAYLISNASSVVPEALQFGLRAFAIDQGFDHPEPWVYLYRHYPFLCPSSVDEAADRIAAIEAGTWRYPGEQAADLIRLSGENPFDLIRQDMGLAALDAQPPTVRWPVSPGVGA